MRRLLVGLASAAAGAALLVPAAAAAEPKPPRLDARAWALVDARDGELLAAHSRGRRLPIASATKLMTAYLALEELEADERLRASAYDGAPAEVVLGLEPGQRITVRDLVVALLLPSANDAAVTLAKGVSGSVRAFVREMNRAARELGLKDTRFANPIGLDEPGNRSSAADLAKLTLELRKRPRFRRIVAKAEASLGVPGRGRVVTRNALLRRVPWVDGVKTGQTRRAGYVLVGSGARRGVELVSVVLGAPSEAARDAETQRLLEYGLSLYDRSAAVPKGRALAEPELRYRDETLPLLAARRVEVVARDDQAVSTAVEAPAEVDGPIEAGEELGRVIVSVDGRRVGTTPLVAAESVEAASALDKLGTWLPAPLIAVGAIVILVGVISARRRASRQRSPEERMRHRNQRASRRERQAE